MRRGPLARWAAGRRTIRAHLLAATLGGCGCGCGCGCDCDWPAAVSGATAEAAAGGAGSGATADGSSAMTGNPLAVATLMASAAMDPSHAAPTALTSRMLDRHTGFVSATAGCMPEPVPKQAHGVSSRGAGG